MLDTFRLPVNFFPEYYFYKLCFELPQNVTLTVELARLARVQAQMR